MALLIARIGLAAIVIGTAAAVVGAGRVTVSLVASTTMCWSFVPMLQLLTGLVLLRDAGARRVEGLGRYFATDRYWTTWLLGYATVLLLAPVPGAVAFWLTMTAVAPFALTARALVTLRREMFGDSLASARRRVAVHQAITLGLIGAYAAWASALWPRIVALGGR